jgi:two-component system response regulator PhoP
MANQILLIDDEPLFRFSVGLALKKRGYRIEQTGDGEDGWKLIAAAHRNGTPYDLILLDLELPTLSGAEIMRRIGAQGAASRVLVISGYTEPETEQELALSGCSGVIPKPVNERLLMERIADLMRETPP